MDGPIQVTLLLNKRSIYIQIHIIMGLTDILKNEKARPRMLNDLNGKPSPDPVLNMTFHCESISLQKFS